MITAWTEEAWEEYVQRQKEDERVLDTINRLVKDIKRNPFKGLGNRSPPFKAGGRASREHRLSSSQERARTSNSISPNVDIIIDCFFELSGEGSEGKAPACRHPPEI